MSPFGGYPDHASCVAAHGDKANPHAFCAWLEHQLTGKWPSESAEMPADAWAIYREPYSNHLTLSKKPALEAEVEANSLGLEALKGAGWLLSRIGWVRQYAAPKMRTVANVRVFASGTWTDSKGVEREWTEAQLDELVRAFNTGVPSIVPIKCGHTPDSFNGVIAEKLGVPVEVITGDPFGHGQVSLGRMVTLERRGPLLIASFERVPEPIADLIEGGQFSTISVEIEGPIDEFADVLTAVAMLGVEEPAIDEATLDRALVFGGKRENARVLSFAQNAASDDDLDKEFNTFRDKSEDIVKGMKGAPIFRAMLAQLRTLFDQIKKRRNHALPPEGIPHKEGSTMDPIKGMSLKDIAAKYQMGEEELMALAAALGLGEGATIEDIIAAVEALKAKAGVVPGPPLPEEAMRLAAEAAAKLAGEGPAAFQKVTSELQKATARISTLEHGELVTAWGKRTSAFQSIPGTPEDMAKDLAEIEETQSKAKAEAHFERLKAVNQAAYTANKVRGVALPGEKRADFEKEVTEYMKGDPKVSRGKAVKAVMLANPTLYREYQAEERAKHES